MQAALALLGVLLWQLAFWLLLRSGSFLGALGANVVFWCAAFPAWAAAARRWWRASTAPDMTFALMLSALTAVACIYAETDLPEATRHAWGWLGFSGVPVALIAALFATLRARALRRARDATGAIADADLWPKPVTVLVIAALILVVALAGFAVLIAVTIPGPR